MAKRQKKDEPAAAQPPTWITTREAAEILGITPIAVRRLANGRAFETRRLPGTQIRVNKADVIAFLDKHTKSKLESSLATRFPGWISMTEAAFRIGVPISEIKLLMSQGQLTTKRTGRGWLRILASDIENFKAVPTVAGLKPMRKTP